MYEAVCWERSRTTSRVSESTTTRYPVMRIAQLRAVHYHMQLHYQARKRPTWCVIASAEGQEEEQEKHTLGRRHLAPVEKSRPTGW